jgi:signal peptidase I
VDFETLFTVLLLVSGLIVLADRMLLAPKRRAVQGAAAREPLVVEYAASFLPVVLIVLIVRSFVFEPFRIPSASMMPGLIDGDFIFVTKYPYGLKLPVVNTKILSTGHPQRGDVIVFRLPSSPSIDYIKRLIGLPGDHIVVRDNQVSVNGRDLPLTAAGFYVGGSEFTGAALERERIDGREHLIMLAPERRATDFDAVVPPGHYYFMGDNRNDSEDSRFDAVGFVPEQNLVGRAAFIWLNWAFPSSPQWRRIGTRIR